MSDLAAIRRLLDAAGYTPNPPATADALSAWEARHAVRLPEAYRRFLLEIGDGGVMPGAYCDFRLLALERVRGAQARRAFPVGRARLRTMPAAPLPELEPYWEDELPPGCVHIGHYPSGDLLLLITAGELRGTVWCAVSGGLPEVGVSGEPLGFTAWLEEALADLMSGTP